MLFVDYFFEVGPNGNMAFDRELTLEKLGWQAGDQFEVELRNNRVVLIKINSTKTQDQPLNDSVPVY